MASVYNGHLPSDRGQRNRGLAASALPWLDDGSAIYDNADSEAYTAELQEAPLRKGGEHQDEGETLEAGIDQTPECGSSINITVFTG